MTILQSVRVLWDTFDRYRTHVVVLIVIGFVSAILEGIGINAAVPLLSFLLGSGGVPTDAISATLAQAAAFFSLPFTFRTLLYFILALFMVRACLVILFGYIRGWIVADFFFHKSRDMLSLMLSASWPFFVGRKMGAVQNTLVRDVQRTSSLLDSQSQVIQSFTGFTIYLLVALTISPMTTLLTFIGGGVLLGIVRPLLRRVQGAAEEMSSTEKDITHLLAEQITGMKSIKSAAVEGQVYTGIERFMANLRRLQIRISLIKSLSAGLFQPFMLFFIVIVFYISYNSPGFSVVSFGATLYLIQKIFTYLESGQGALHAVNENLPYAHSVERFRQTLQESQEPSLAAKKPFRFTKELQGKKLSLSYGGGEPVLQEVSFSVRPGEMLALIGPSGAGKTSLTDLMLRLFEPRSGEILLDGTPAREIDLKEWRAHFAYVAQDPFLFNGTIEENIRFFRPTIGMNEIEAAARDANIFDFIMSLPDKFRTVVGDRGVMLSGGQRQRVVLARALAGKPSILVLDEATSALDSDSERLIQEAIRSLHGSVTVITIAHRLSTVNRADYLIVLEKGKVLEEGSPQQLLDVPGSYYATRGGAAS